MKKLTTVLLLAVLVSCNQQKNETSDSSKETISTTETPLSSTANQLSGNWISKPYLENIAKTKSIYPHRNAAIPLFIKLNKDELLKGDATLQGFTAHEGGLDAKLKFDETKKEFVINGKSDDPTYKDFSGIKPNGDHLEMVYKGKTEIYQKFDGDPQNELRKMLFEGNYTEKNATKVNFGVDGKVNFKDYTQYEVMYDFADGTQTFDGILLGKGNSTKDLYQFKIKGNTIELQQMKESEQGFKAEGEKYILTKK